MKNKIISIIVSVAVLGGIGYFFFEQNKDANVPASQPTEAEEIKVSPQEARTSVTIDSATFTKGGYVVVRGSDGKRIGQVIEISSYLPTGTHTNITIELGAFYTYNQEDQLIAMIYHDDGDKSFNELDQPINSSAVFAETGNPVIASVFEHEVAPSDGMGMVTVRYTNTGFEPVKLTVPVGTMVEFINQSDEEMWVASNMHPSHEILSTFDQFQGVGKSQSYMYTFDKKGIWPYHDHINPALEGVITVE
ncbi:hypothetical protein C4568_03100 [Candidatus Parcubacteria bacterium]|nr:MAG: hypothetical protein C4568_03100 [Candidatus Parcubacteria bacterium]